MTKIPLKPISPTVKSGVAPTIITRLFPDPTFEGEVTDSIIHPQFGGLNLITGFRGHGKSSLAMSWDNPNNVIMLDFEDKEETAAEELGIKAYFPVMKEVIGKMGANFDIEHIYNRTLQIIEAIPLGRFTTLVIDNAQDLQEGSCQKIARDPELIKRFGLKQKNVETGGFGGAMAGAKRLIDTLLHLINGKGIKITSVTFQLKQAWANNQPAFNKWKTSDVTTWHEKSRLTMVMVPPMPENFPVPRALIMKEAFSLRKWSEELKRVIQIKRFPSAIPRALPHEIYNYLDHPADFKNPKPGETVTALELAPYTPSFSNEQLFLLERMVRAQEKMGIGGEGGE